jgi:hypothetical protein
VTYRQLRGLAALCSPVSWKVSPSAGGDDLAGIPARA